MAHSHLLDSGKLWVKGQNGWVDAKSLNSIYTESISRYQAIKIIEAFLKKRLQKLSKSKYTHLTAAPVSKCSVREDVLWLQISTMGSRENQGYSTLGELIRRLDLSGSVWQQRRFAYVICVTEVILEKKFLGLGGTAQKHFFQLIDCLVNRVIQTQERIRQMRRILAHLARIMFTKNSNLIGSKSLWFAQIEFIRKCQSRLNLLQIPQRVDNRLTLTDMPINVQHKILTYLDDVDDMESLEKVNKNFHSMCKQDLLWKKMVMAQFTEIQLKEGMKMIDHRRKMQIKRTGKSKFNEPLTWREIYDVLIKLCKKVEEFADPLLFCYKCNIIFWKETGHPCVLENTSAVPDFKKITPTALISYF